MNEPYKQMYYQLCAEMANVHRTLQTVLQNIEEIMQKTEELYMSSGSEEDEM